MTANTGRTVRLSTRPKPIVPVARPRAKIPHNIFWSMVAGAFFCLACGLIIIGWR